MKNILILHGWGSRAKNWSRVKEILEAGGCKVLAPDLPGFGENSVPEKSWSINEYIDWVRRYIDSNFSEPFVLLGHSFGGGLAIKSAGEFPDKIKKLILVGAKIRRHKTIEYYIGMFLGKLGVLVFSIPWLSFLRPFGQRILYKLIGTSDYYALEIKKAVTMKETFKKIVGEDLTPFLRKIKIPTLIIWGEKDKVTPPKDAYLINKEIAGSRLEFIKGQGHVPHMETPEILAEKILNFIGQKDNAFPSAI